MKLSIWLLDALLPDMSTNKNIVWATNDYIDYGDSYAPECQIIAEQIVNGDISLIRPRVEKTQEQQADRTRNKAEVFTPSWICNQQNNLIDEQWFNRPDVFNTTDNKTWKSTQGKILFSNETGKTWKDYVKAKRMEITCGEAPYLVSRYDTVTGEIILDVNERIGLLDRKLRVVNENTDNLTDWLKWVKTAYQSIYGYEYQGDNLLLARENLIMTFIENKVYKFGEVPAEKEIKSIAEIISWNLWQMDGLTYTAPFSETEHINEEIQFALIGFDDEPEIIKEPVFCIIKDWTSKDKKKTIEYRTLVKKG